MNSYFLKYIVSKIRRRVQSNFHNALTRVIQFDCTRRLIYETVFQKIRIHYLIIALRRGRFKNTST
jgi:hypothetical protein